MRQLLALFCSLFIFSNQLDAQEIFGKAKNNYRNFSNKKTMVVSNASDFTDLALMDAVKSGWKISEFEFCSTQQFEKMRRDTMFYFLLRVEGKFRKEGEASIEYLTLVKGGPASDKGISKMQEIVSLPLQAVGDETGKVFVFFPAFIDIIQEHILNVSEDILKAYVGNSFYSNRIEEYGSSVIIFDQAEIGYPVTEEDIEELFAGKAILADAAAAEEAMQKAAPQTIVSLAISPSEPKNGSYSYKMLIDAQTNKMVFFRRHKISPRLPAGFTREDIKRISIPFQR
jgi:hypothetical protein